MSVSTAALEHNAEAGMGASATNDATPTNVTLTAPRDGAAVEGGNAGALQEKKVGEAEVEPEKERSKAKIAIIMFALGVRIMLFRLCRKSLAGRFGW